MTGSAEPEHKDRASSAPTTAGDRVAIKGIRLAVVEIVLPRRFYFRRNDVDRRRYSLAEVRLASGQIGRAYSLVRSVPAAIIAEEIALGLIGQSFAGSSDLVSAWPAWQLRTELSKWPIAQALALLENAAWDAYAHRLDEPQPRAGTRPVPAMAVVGYRFDGPETAVDEASAAANDGYASVKLPVGDRSAAGDLAILTEIRRRHPELRIHVDAHWNFDSANEAAEHFRPMSELGIVWLEDALPIQVQPRWLGLGWPEAIGDDVLDPVMLHRALGQGLTVRPDVSNLGVTGWRSVVDEARNHGGLVCNHVHAKLHAPLLADVPVLHPSGIERFYDETGLDPIEPLIVGGARVERGSWRIPGEPGFGITFDWGRLDQFTTWRRDLDGPGE